MISSCSLPSPCTVSAAWIALLVLAAAPVFASTSLPETRERNAPLIMENADRFEGNRSRGEYVLSGKVRFRHGQMLMETERAVWMKDRNIVVCESGMRITRNGSLLTADRGSYDKNMGQATAEGHVFMRDSSGENTATGHTVVYLRFRHLATLTGNPEVRRFYVKKDSAAKDTLAMKPANATAPAKDSAIGMRTGDSAAAKPAKSAGRLRTAKAANSAKSAKDGAADSDGPDTLSIKGDLMTYNDSLRVAVADGNVRIRREKMNITCKKAEYHGASDSLYLLGEPVVVVEDSRVKGDVMRLGMHGEEIKSLLVKGSAQAHSTEPATDTSVARQSDVNGDSLFLAFKEKAIDSVQIFKNAKGAYFDVDKPEFVNKMSGDYMVLRFNGKQVASANVMGGNSAAKSTYYHFEKKLLKGKNDAEGDTIDFAFKNGKIDEVIVKGTAKGTYYGEKQRKSPAGSDQGLPAADSVGASSDVGKAGPVPAEAEAGKRVPPVKSKREKPAPNIPWRVK